MHKPERFEKFIISQKGLLIKDDKALLMNMAKFPGSWDLPGGRIDVGEDPVVAFKREMKEELSIDNFVNYGVCDCSMWTTPAGQPVCGIVNLIDTDEDLEMCGEHTEMQWVKEEDIDKYNFLWPMFGNMIKRGFEFHRHINR